MRYILILFVLCGAKLFGQVNDAVFQELKTKNFFKAKELYKNTQASYSLQEQELIEATLENAFNRPKRSNERIDLLLNQQHELSDSILLQLHRLKIDNFIKLFEYNQAKETIEYIVNEYRQYLDERDLADTENSFKIWNALKDEPQQEIFIPRTSVQKMKTDQAGLKNLTISTAKDSIYFIFDTGANISTLTESSAQRLNVKIIPAGIEVGSITGDKINADLGICPQMKLGDIEIKNVVFLVVKDDVLYFPQIDYRINGIIGFPVINALREIQITNDDFFVVPENTTQINEDSNMALDGLKPLIYMNGMHFTFDSGANQSMLYHTFYLKHKQEINEKYLPAEFSIGGAAGTKKLSGFAINQSFDILGKTAEFDDLMVITEKISENETVYGNIGQDLIKQFSKMTLNFDSMFIKFD